MKKIMIIGGGASGLATSIILRRKGLDVTILECNSNVGKKILVTGNGKCNYMNDDFSIDHYTSNDLDILEKIITDDNKNKILEFFDSLGVVARIKNGYYYPQSNQAVSIWNVLVTEARNLGVKFIVDTTVSSISYNNGYVINGKYNCDKVILATGSRALYDKEANSLGYDICNKFNLHINKVLPGLVGLKCAGDYFKEWAGIRSEVGVSLYIDNKFVKEECGEIQLTNYGVSGICSMQLSNYAIPAFEDKKEVYLSINFLRYLGISSSEDFKGFICKRNNDLLNRTISELFDTVLNYKLSNLILKLVGIKLDSKVSSLSLEDLLALGEYLTNFRLKVIGYNDFKDAQICLGGVSLKDININSFEANNQKNLYVIGELLDVNGDCGGYNLGFAWLSGILCGEAICLELDK